MGQTEAIERDMAAIRRRRKSLRQAMKLANFNLTQFDMALKERDRDDGSTLSNLKDFRIYCQYLELPLGSQFELFDKPATPKDYSQEARLKKAYSVGYEHGVAGATADSQAYPEMTPEGQEYLRGWTEGQAVNTAMFVKLNERLKAEDEKAAAKRAAKSKSKDDEDDDDGDDEDADEEAEEQAEAAE